MRCLSKPLSAGLGHSLPMQFSILNLTSMFSSFSYNAPEVLALNSTSAGGFPTEGGGWVRVHGSNLFPMETSNAPVKVGSRSDAAHSMLF
jgi:hypothetical protein